MDLPLFAVIRNNKLKIVLSVVSFWLIIGGMIYFTEEVIAANYFGAKALDRIEKMQYLVRWIIWPLLTPLIIFLALKFRLRRTHILRFVIVHMLLGTAMLTLEYLLEISIIKFAAWNLYREYIPVNEYTIPFLFKYWAYISIYFLIAGIVNVFLYIHKYQLSETSLVEKDLKNKQLEYELTLAQLNSLKMQLQPHFLFNTHNAIISLMLQNENSKAIEMLTRLSELLRLTIDKSEAPTISLREEIHYMRLYLDIQQIRFQDRLRIEINMADELNEMEVPTFILQPLIENAITHGIAPYSDAGNIHISAYTENGCIRICIADDGHGISHTGQKSGGLGIKNTQNRLRQLYGEAQSLRLVSNAMGGTTSIIEINTHE